MNAVNPVLLNAEFGLLWAVHQLLRGIAIGIGLALAMVVLSLFAVAGALGTLMEVLKERSQVTRFSPHSNDRPR